MPIYEYRCPNGHTFEVFQRMTDPPSETCETCGAGPVEKILFPIAVHFKGSGFYSTDYGRRGQKGAKEEGGGGEEKAPKTEKSDTPATSGGATDKGGGEKTDKGGGEKKASGPD